METIFDHNITPEELAEFFGPVKDNFKADYLRIVDSPDAAFAHIYKLYLMRGDQATADKFLQKIQDDQYRFDVGLIDVLPETSLTS